MRVFDRSQLILRKYPVFSFISLFIIIFLGLYRVLYTDFSVNHIHPFLIRINTLISGKLLSLLGENVTISSSIIASKNFAIKVIFDCCAIEPILIYVTAILSYPASLKIKLKGLMTGVTILFIMNIVRIISLYYFGAYLSTRVMERMHLDVWQVLIVIFSIGLFLYWIYSMNVRLKNGTDEVT